MERRDHLIKQFEALGEALSKLLSKVSLFKEREASDIQIAEINDLMKSEVGLDLHEIASLSDEAFLTHLLEKKLEASDLSNMVNLLVELAPITNGRSEDYDSNQLLTKALFLGNYIATSQKVAFFENIAPLNEARKLLKQGNNTE
jgi:hypothetical protein